MSSHNLKCKVYPHKKLNTSKEVIRNKELFLAILEETHAALGKQGVTYYKRITIRRGEEEIQVHAFWYLTNP